MKLGKSRLAVATTSVAALLALTSACGTSSSGNSTGEQVTASDIRVVFIAALVNDSFFVTVKCGAEAKAKELGIDFEFQGPTTADVASEIKAFKAAAATGPDGMVLAPFSNTGFSGDVKQQMAAGVPVALSGQALDPPEAMTTFVTNYLEAAKQLEPIFGDLTGGEGTIGIVATSTGNKTDSDRYTELMPVLKDKYPNLTILDPQYADNSTAKASTITAALIQGNPDLKVIYATSGPQAVGAASAIKAAGVGDKVKVVSFDSNPEQFDLLKNGELAATVGQSPYQSGAMSVESVVNYVLENGAKGPKVTASDKTEDLPTMLLTPDNVDSPEAQKYAYLESCPA